MRSINATVSAKPGGRKDPPPRKLKDSCDMCSSSKVKCDKKKPNCGRCRKLGYPCFYSPARRIGRPHPNRRTISRPSPEARPPCLKLSTASNDSTPPTPKDLQFPVAEAQSQQTPFIWKGSGGETGCSDNPLQWLDEICVSPACAADNQGSLGIASRIALPYSFSGLFNHNRVSRNPMSPLEAPGLFNFPDAISEDAYWMHSLPPGAGTSFFSLGMNSVQGSSEAPNQAHPDSWEALSCNQTSDSYLSEPDCVTGTIEILRQLRAFQSRASRTQENRTGLDILERVQIASSAINRLATIMVCPCSQKSYVGILVATVCLEILDVYDLLFTQTQQAGHLTNSTGQFTGMEFTPPLSMDADSQIGGCEKLALQIPSVQALGELSRLANVGMQFSRRYKADPSFQSTSALAALADFLRVRLRSVTNEAIHRGAN